jgi:hypothetical protein
MDSHQRGNDADICKSGMHPKKSPDITHPGITQQGVQLSRLKSIAVAKVGLTHDLLWISADSEITKNCISTHSATANVDAPSQTTQLNLWLTDKTCKTLTIPDGSGLLPPTLPKIL